MEHTFIFATSTSQGARTNSQNCALRLNEGKAAALVQARAISGLGGVGKTQLAVEYAYRYGADYDIVWWIRSEDIVTLVNDYASLAVELDLPEKDATEQRVAVEAVKKWLRRESQVAADIRQCGRYEIGAQLHSKQWHGPHHHHITQSELGGRCKIAFCKIVADGQKRWSFCSNEPIVRTKQQQKN